MAAVPHSRKTDALALGPFDHPLHGLNAYHLAQTVIAVHQDQGWSLDNDL
jgi:hypothetical protein